MLGRKAGRENMFNYRKSLDLMAVKASFHGCYSSDGVFTQKRWRVWFLYFYSRAYNPCIISPLSQLPIRNISVLIIRTSLFLSTCAQ
jgi:hypothetical protein